ncbi:MAG: hypothetical protein LQ344_000908 [Seirophora lacunosa]|nr:MAG: hypothetical protein LQ344_000908 [Seirophora lacunosa]
MDQGLEIPGPDMAKPSDIDTATPPCSSTSKFVFKTQRPGSECCDRRASFNGSHQSALDPKLNNECRIQHFFSSHSLSVLTKNTKFLASNLQQRNSQNRIFESDQITSDSFGPTTVFKERHGGLRVPS